MRIVFTGGGTVGHINPALALANALGQKEKETEILFIGTKEGMETQLVPKAGYTLSFIEIYGFDRSFTWQNIKNVMKLPFAILQARKILKKFKPDVVVGTGGYVCGPVLYAAAKMKIPTMVHESNAFPGVTTKLLSTCVDTVALGVEDAAQYLPKAKHIYVTGTPVRPSLLQGSALEARRVLNLNEKPFLVFFGGSLGARDFNRTVVDFIVREADKHRFRMLMATGKNHHYQTVMERFSEAGVDIENHPDIDIVEYIYNMDVVMHGADVLVCRAGASTLCELTALGKPAVLVPSPYVTDNHQEHNARAMERGGAACVILEKDFTQEALSDTIEGMVSHQEKLDGMKRAAYKMGKRDAIDVLCEEIHRLAR